jgi:altronate dehydratase small subunit
VGKKDVRGKGFAGEDFQGEAFQLTIGTSSRRFHMAQKSKAMVINEKDNVAVAIVPLKSGTIVPLDVQGKREKIKLISTIPMGHKFALREIPKGADVIKYGEPIGETTAAIARGEHVHVHNVNSHRGRKEGA